MGERIRAFGRLWVDEDTGQTLGEDMYGVIHVLPPAIVQTREAENVWSRLLIHGYHEAQWPGVGSFYPMENVIDSDGPLVYTVPEGSTAHITSVVAAQSIPGLALIGMYVNGNYIASTPFYAEIAHAITTDLPIVGGTQLEIRFRPANRNSEFAILMGGYLSNG
jgi:hypothetical protein